MPSTKPKKNRKPFYALSRKQQWVRKKRESEQSGSNSSQLHECISSELSMGTGNAENRALESDDNANFTSFDDPSLSVNRLSSSASAASSTKTDNAESHDLESDDDS